jgi:hypothetical protein
LPRKAPSTSVHRTSHHEEQDGPRLAPAGDERREPRQLKSVLVRRPTEARPIGEATTLARQEADGKGEDARIVPTATNDEGDPAISQQDVDPFEINARPGASVAGPREREPLPLRLAQADTSGRPMRSVLQLDPFEREPGQSEQDKASDGKTLVSQPGEAAAPPEAQVPEEDVQVPQLPQSGLLGEEQEDNAFAPDTSIEKERERAAEICQRALDTIKTRGINTLDLGIGVAGTVGETLPFECSLDTEEYKNRNWEALTFMWKASALCHKPLYFEDVHLERYGHCWGWHLQPFVSGAHFFTTLPILPYKMGLETPNECVYSLGYYRPGNCAPYLIEPLGTSPRAVVWQAGAVVGVSALVP